MTGHRGNERLSLTGLAHLLVVYVVWSTTYLAIRIGVREGAGMPPFMFVASRIFTASILLFIISILRKDRIRISRTELPPLLSGSVFLWVLGSGLIVIAEQHISSGFAGIIVGSAPAWATLFDSFFRRRRPYLLVIVSIAVSFSGLALVLRGEILRGPGSEPLSVMLAFAGTISWSFGMTLQKRWHVGLSSIAASAYQQFFAGIMLFALSIIFREKTGIPHLAIIQAWLYLVIAGSVIAFTSFVKMVRLLPITIASTYAYVNPVFAVLLGCFFLSEQADIYTVSGMIIVILGIAGIYYGQYSVKGKKSVKSA